MTIILFVIKILDEMLFLKKIYSHLGIATQKSLKILIYYSKLFFIIKLYQKISKN